MQIEPLKFKEFSGGATTPVVTGKTAKPFLPGGRFKGEAPPPPPALFTEEQLKSAERDSYKKGFLEGTEEGKRQAQSEQANIDRALADMMRKFAEACAPLAADYREARLQMQKDMPKVALAIARKVAGQALAENAPSAVEDVAMRCVEVMIGEPKLTVTVHESLTKRLELRLQQLQEHLKGVSEILVIGDKDLPVADCRIEWRHGQFLRQTDKLWQEVERVLESMVASAVHHTDEHIKALKAEAPEAKPAAAPATPTAAEEPQPKKE